METRGWREDDDDGDPNYTRKLALVQMFTHTHTGERRGDSGRMESNSNTHTLTGRNA